MKVASQISEEAQLLLQLLNDACWERQDTKLPEYIGKVLPLLWRLAVEQGVTALVANQLITHHAKLLPMPLVVKLMESIRVVKNSNDNICQATQDLQNGLSQLGVASMIVKGPISASYYPDPDLRMPGDIDLYVWEREDYTQAKKWIEDHAIKEITEGVSRHEKAYLLPLNVKLELHHQIVSLHNKRHQQLFISKVEEAIAGQKLKAYAVRDTVIWSLPTTLNAIYLFLHLFTHFLYTGIGLKQIYDWLLFLRSEGTEMDDNLHNYLAEDLKLLPAMQAFGAMAVEYLGAEPDLFPFEIQANDKMSLAIMEDIIEGGNFGLHDEAHTKGGGKWIRNYRLTKGIIRRSIRFGSLAPHYYRGATFYKIREALRL